ncbi:MAG: DNA polymerase [Candidatus Pacebacteria bacterium]|nr:DNA polymerase [Candidatus Paceibacterota bacterium]
MPKEDTPTLVLLDSHAILHRAYHALPDFSSPTGEPTGALYGVTTMLIKIIEDFKPQYIAACYDLPEPTYRHEAYGAYKAGRKKTDEALISQIIRSREIFEHFGIPIFEKIGFEADDLLGTIAHLTAENKNLKVIIASGDMDTLQCVDKKRVQVFTLKRGIKDTIIYDEKAVKDRFGFGPNILPDYKGLRGDPSDNIPGIRGIGEKTATTLLTNFGSLEKLYKKLKKNEQSFLDIGITPRIVGLLKEGKEDAEFSKMLATIRTDAIDSFDLDSTEWKEHANTEKIINLFSEFGFRNMNDRISRLFDITLVDDAAEAEKVDDTELKKAAILLWLLESERTNADYEDIIDYGRSFLQTKTWDETITALMEKVKTEGLWNIYSQMEEPLVGVIAEMKKQGITLNTPYLKKLSKKLHKELGEIEGRIYKIVGTEFNINSPKQLGEVLFDTLELKPKSAKKTAGGQRSTKESELEKLKDQHPIIEDILRYRELKKLVSTYIDNLPDLVGEDGKIHSTLLQTGTTTGRMASRDPNLQNIPARTEEGRAIRKAFEAESGHTLVAIDYSQVELRIAAILSEDQNLMDIFKQGEDIHKGVAMRVFGVTEKELTSDMRRKAKIINFGILYGMGVNALKQNLGEDTTRQAAQEFLNAYFNTFTRLAEYLEETKSFAREHGHTETLFGRQRHFPGITSSVPFIRAQAERMAVNAPIQGSQADIIRIAMNNINSYIKKEKLEKEVRMLLQVHDELIFEIKDEKLKEVVPNLLKIMTSVVDDKKTKGVPINADIKMGQNWEELKTVELKDLK